MQDLTPQLRTRLSRLERVVGVFVIVAVVLLLVSFGYYVYHTAQRKGWFVLRVRYCTTIDSAAGLAVGDPVKLFGFNVGEITRIDTQPPDEFFNVYVEFTVRAPYFGYLWTHGSKARVTAADMLGKRYLEVTKGDNYIPTYLVWSIHDYAPAEAARRTDLDHLVFLDQIPGPGTNPPLTSVMESVSSNVLEQIAAAGVSQVRVADRSRTLHEVTAVWSLKSNRYVPYSPNLKPYWLPPEESPALVEQLGGVINQTTFMLTNQLATILSNTVTLTAEADATLAKSSGLLSNLTAITANLRNPRGSLGQWLLPPGMPAQLRLTLTNADTTLTSASMTLTNTSATLAAANSNLTVLVAQLQPPLQNLATIISNLNLQVHANTNFVTTLHTLLADTDDLIQGFKRFWLFRSAFRKPTPKVSVTNAPPRRLSSPRGATWVPGTRRSR